jgi:CheY-like chemotaxis protein
LFETPPDILLIDATMPGIDAKVICRELGNLAIASRLRVIVVRPATMAEHDEAIREAGAWTILDAPVSLEDICENLSLSNGDVPRIKAS